MRRADHESIVYAADTRDDPLLLAVILWAWIAPPLLYYLHFYRADGTIAGWFASLRGFGVTTLLALAAGLVLYGVAYALSGWLYTYTRRAAGEAETHSAIRGLLDKTSIEKLDRAIGLLAPLVVLLLLAARWGGLIELLLGGVIWLGVKYGAYRLERFPPPTEQRLPYTADQLEGFLAQTADDDGAPLTTIEYRWRFDPHPYASQATELEHHFDIPFDPARYDEAAARPHPVTTPFAYAEYVAADRDAPELAMVAWKLSGIHHDPRHHYTRFQQLRDVLAFTTQFRYVPDADSKGQAPYPRYPLETLYDAEGDGDCHAILAAALLDLLGFEVLLLPIDFDRDPGRLAIGLAGADDMPAELAFHERGGRRFFWAEPVAPRSGTAAGGEWHWRVGEMPLSDPTRVTPVPLVGGSPVS